MMLKHYLLGIPTKFMFHVMNRTNNSAILVIVPLNVVLSLAHGGYHGFQALLFHCGRVTRGAIRPRTWTSGRSCRPSQSRRCFSRFSIAQNPPRRRIPFNIGRIIVVTSPPCLLRRSCLISGAHLFNLCIRTCCSKNFSQACNRRNFDSSSVESNTAICG